MSRFCALVLSLWCFCANAVNINILFVYTPGAVSYFGNITNPTTLEVARMNTVFSDSQGGYGAITVTGSAVTTPLNYGPEATSWNSVQNDINVLAARDSAAADVVIVVTCVSNDSDCDYNGDPHACGFNGGDGYGGILLGAKLAFALVDSECLVLNKSAQHELGHILGTRDDATWDSNQTPYLLGHGFVSNVKSGATPPVQLSCFWTIMARGNWYCNKADGNPGSRVGYYSNPSVNYQSYPTGNAAYWWLANEMSVFNTTIWFVTDYHSTLLAAPRYGAFVSVIDTLLVNP